jgi:thiol-disulfide isomerase/thioredoxin
MRVLTLLPVLCGIASAQSTRTACTVPVSVAKEVQALPLMSDLSRSWEERMAPRRTLAKKYPGNWALQFTLQDAIRRHFQIGGEWDQAIAFYRSMEDRTLGELLEARLISPFHRRQSRAALDRALATASDSPWVHLFAAEWGRHPVAISDHALTERSFEEFRRLCPDVVSVFRSLEGVKDPEKMARHVVALRQLIDASKIGTPLADDDLGLFRTLWTWEKAAYSNDMPEFEKRVRTDLSYLRRTSQYDSPSWYSVVRSGYELSLRDTAAIAALEEEALAQAPLSQAAFWILTNRSRGSNPRSQPVPEEILSRINRFFNRPFIRFEANMLLMRQSPELTKEQADRLAKFILRSAESYPDMGASFPPDSMQVADAYVTYQINLDEVPGLVAKALEGAELQEKYRRNSDAMPNVPGRGLVDNIVVAQRRAREVLIRHAIATGDKDRAAQLIANLRSELEQTKPVNNTDGTWRMRHSQYLQLARQAGIEAQPIAELLPTSLEQRERFPVADFEAKDLSGKTWKLSDLKGKVTFVNVWTTWCGPCRAEMPLIEKLKERWKDRPDRVVLTISADSHRILAESFIKEHKYTFPVIFGKETAEKFFPPIAFPQNWLIDAQGRRLDYQLPVPDEAGIQRVEELAAKLK